MPTISWFTSRIPFFVQDEQYAELLGPLALVKPPALQLWDDALAMRGALRYGASGLTPPVSSTRRSGAADWYAIERMACNMGALINLDNTDTSCMRCAKNRLLNIFWYFLQIYLNLRQPLPIKAFGQTKRSTKAVKWSIETCCKQHLISISVGHRGQMRAHLRKAMF
jgi:hypothetical protein